MKKLKIYDIDYLLNEELTDEDLHYLFDKHSLIYSLIIGEFKEANYELSDKEIIKLVNNDKEWMYKYYWNKKQLDRFTNKLFKIYKNVYYYNYTRCKSEVEWFIIMYGLNNKMQKGKKLKTLMD